MIMEKYFKNRRNPLSSDANLEEAFRELVETFEENWLESAGAHQLQKLWKRKDVYSTVELYSLGEAIRSLKQINKSWVKQQIDLILGRDENNRKGALFELIGLSFLTAQDRLILANKCQAGIDAFLVFNKDSRINLSLKRYGISHPHKEFLTYAQEIENLVERIAQLNRVKSSTVLIEKLGAYPRSSDWKKLRSALPKVIVNFAGISKSYRIGNWSMVINPLEGELLDQRRYSHSLIIISPYHQNEALNLYSKMEDACINLSKNKVLESEDIINSIFIHVPVTASITNCKKWIVNYFNEYTDKPISEVIFYQPSVITNLSDNSSIVQHCFSVHHRDNYLRWKTRFNNPPVEFNLPVGIVSESPSEMKLIIDERQIKIEDYYIFQKGIHYRRGKREIDGKIVGHIQKLAPGIETILIMEMNGEELLFRGHFPPTDELLLL